MKLLLIIGATSIFSVLLAVENSDETKMNSKNTQSATNKPLKGIEAIDKDAF